MKDIEHWKRIGFTFEMRFPREYDLWVNHKTLQKLRRYVDGGEWLSNLSTEEYAPVQDTPSERANIPKVADDVPDRVSIDRNLLKCLCMCAAALCRKVNAERIAETRRVLQRVEKDQWPENARKAPDTAQTGEGSHG